MNAILEMVKEAGSGTAVSVLATKGEGEGTLVQAIFEPSRVTNFGDVNWLGYLHSLWVDDVGQIREDTVNDYKLDTRRTNALFSAKNRTVMQQENAKTKASCSGPTQTKAYGKMQSRWTLCAQSGLPAIRWPTWIRYSERFIPTAATAPRRIQTRILLKSRTILWPYGTHQFFWR